MTPSRARPRALRAGLVALACLALGAAAAAAHASLQSSLPSDRAVLDVTPDRIVASFDEALDPERSRIELRDTDGTVVASGALDPTDGTATTMRIDPPPLPPGTYEVRWTAVTPDDDGVTRGIFSFTVAQASATPAATPIATLEPTSPPTSAPAPPPTPPPGGGSGGAGDVVVPLLALGAVVAAAVLFLLRRPRGPVTRR